MAFWGYVFGASIAVALLSLVMNWALRFSLGRGLVCVLSAAFVYTFLAGFGEGEGGFGPRLNLALSGAMFPVGAISVAFLTALLVVGVPFRWLAERGRRTKQG